MSSKILSIVVPAYNVERYIERCLDSVTMNVKNIDNLDIIVINDGSSDSTLELAHKYEQLYPQSVRVIDKPNGGWGSGINRGIDEAVGKYLKTLDSDDWFDSHNLDLFVELLQKIDVDMVLTSLSEVDADNNIREKNVPNALCGKIMQIDEYIIKNNYNLGAPIHALTYRTSILKKSGWKVIDKYYGDLDYIISPLIYITTIYLSSLNIYQYFLGRDGQSVSVAGYNKHLDDYLNACNKSVEFWINNKEKFSKPIRQIVSQSTVERIRWAYVLLMSPVYSGNRADSEEKLRQLDNLVKQDRALYKITNKITYKKFIPWIYIWRRTRINLFKLRNK